MSAITHSMQIPNRRRGRFACCNNYVSSEDSFIYPYRIGSSQDQISNQVDSELALSIALADDGQSCFSCAEVQRLPYCGRCCWFCVVCCGSCCSCRRFFNLASFSWIVFLLICGTGFVVYGFQFETCYGFQQLYPSVGAIMYLCVALYFSSVVFDRKELRKYLLWMLYPWVLLCVGLLATLLYALVIKFVSIHYFVIMVIPIVGLGGYVLGEVFLTIERQRLRPLLIQEKKFLRVTGEFKKEDGDWTSRTISLHGLSTPETPPKFLTAGAQPSTSQALPHTTSTTSRQAAGQGGASGDSIQQDKLRLLSYHKGKLSVWQARRFKIRHHNTEMEQKPTVLVVETPEHETPLLTREIPQIPLQSLSGSSLESLDEPHTSASRLLPRDAWHETPNRVSSPSIPDYISAIADTIAMDGPIPSSGSYNSSGSHVPVHLPQSTPR